MFFSLRKYHRIHLTGIAALLMLFLLILPVSVGAQSLAVKEKNMVKASDLKFRASDFVYQSKRIRVSYKGIVKPRFFSESSVVKVDDNGVVTVPYNYVGVSFVKVIVPSSDRYNVASTRVKVTVKRKHNMLEAYNLVKDYSEEPRSYSLGVQTYGNPKITYKSDSLGVRVRGGIATIARRFSGTATITITAKASGIYSAAKKEITVTVLPGQAEKLYQAARSQIGISGHGKNLTKYGRFTGQNGQAWCASFVAWCARKAGIQSRRPSQRSVVPRTASTLAMCEYSTNFRYWGKYSMHNIKKGDVIFFSRVSKAYAIDGHKKVCHVGIVESANSVTNKITVIEGNSTGDSVRRRKYSVDVKTGKAGSRFFCGYISVR